MFDLLVESTSHRKNTRTVAIFALSSLGGLAAIVTVAVVGILLTDIGLAADLDRAGVLIAGTPPSPPPPPRAQSEPVTARTQATPVRPAMQAVTTLPTEIHPPSPAPPVGPSMPSGLPTGSETGRPGGEIGGTGTDFGDHTGHGASDATARVGAPPEPPQPQPPVEPSPKPEVIQVARNILVGKALRRVEPPYPQIALSAHVQGDVLVEVTVSESGNVVSARAVSGHPLLRQAAVNAANGWKFSPTILNGKPVKVVGTITFAFKGR